MRSQRDGVLQTRRLLIERRRRVLVQPRPCAFAADLVHTVEAIAGACGISRETVRNQLKAVLAKTGLGRQVELAGLLAGAKVPPGSSAD